MTMATRITALLRLWKILLGVLGIAVLIVWSSGALREKTPPGVVPHLAGFPLPDGTTTATIRRETIPSRISVAGTVTSEEKIQVSTRVGGVVDSVMISAGDSVARDQALLTIDDREIREQLAAAEAQLNRAETEFNRTRQLFAAQAATQQQLTDAESSFHTAQARVDQLRVARSHYRIQAPIDGVVTDRRIEPGDLAQPGQLLLAVYNPSAMRLEVPVPVRLIERLSIGTELPVTLDRLEMPLAGVVTEIVREVDTASRTQLVRVRLIDPPTDLPPGTFGRLIIDAEAHEGFLAPESAVFRVGQLEMVQVVTPDQRVIRRLVRTGPRENGQVELLSGVDDGDRIVVKPLLDI